jgi:hypothetical protein
VRNSFPIREKNRKTSVAEAIMKKIQLFLVLTFVLLVGSFGRVERANAVLFSADTNSSSPTTIDTFLSFTGASFTNLDVPAGAGPTVFTNLGYFTLNLCSGVNCSENFGSQDGVSDFSFRINFTNPNVFGSPEVLGADIFGTINRSGNSNNIGSGSTLSIDLDNTIHHFTYVNATGSGAFDFSVNDPATYTAASQFGDTRIITGQITNLTFAPSTEGSPSTQVPEPSTLILFGIGIIGISFFRRRGASR